MINHELHLIPEFINLEPLRNRHRIAIPFKLYLKKKKRQIKNTFVSN